MFNYTYPVNCSETVLNTAWDFVADVMNHSGERPQVLTVHHEHMQRAAVQRHSLIGDVYGWFTPETPGIVYVSDKVKPANNKKHTSWIVHEMVHHVQCEQGRLLLPVRVLEREAVQIELSYLMNH
jgi:hypothetical protein